MRINGAVRQIWTSWAPGVRFILHSGDGQEQDGLKRDLSYLSRLWKDMEARKRVGNKPRLLYSERPLVRACGTWFRRRFRDHHRQRGNSPGGGVPESCRRGRGEAAGVQGQTPLFHAFGIEQQIAIMHAGFRCRAARRLVIDETEALVAIDVNSGKMRDARDAETSVQNQRRAVERICRQPAAGLGRDHQRPD
jgi:Ribonuclease G/E